MLCSRVGQRDVGATPCPDQVSLINMIIERVCQTPHGRFMGLHVSNKYACLI
jgi:hypothetical protein